MKNSLINQDNVVIKVIYVFRMKYRTVIEGKMKFFGVHMLFYVYLAFAWDGLHRKIVIKQRIKTSEPVAITTKIQRVSSRVKNVLHVPTIRKVQSTLPIPSQPTTIRTHRQDDRVIITMKKVKQNLITLINAFSSLSYTARTRLGAGFARCVRIARLFSGNIGFMDRTGKISSLKELKIESLMMSFQVAYKEYCKRYQGCFNPRMMSPRDSWWRDYLYNLVPRMEEPTAPQPTPAPTPKMTLNERKTNSSTQTHPVKEEQTMTGDNESEGVTGMLNDTFKNIDLGKPEA